MSIYCNTTPNKPIKLKIFSAEIRTRGSWAKSDIGHFFQCIQIDSVKSYFLPKSKKIADDEF